MIGGSTMTRNPLSQATLDRIVQEKRDFAPIAAQMMEEFRRMCALSEEEFNVLIDEELGLDMREEPLDTPLDLWVAGVDALLEQLHD